MNYPPKIDPKKETESIKKFIQDTLKVCGLKKAIVATSGGIDSSTTLLLTAKSLKPKNTFALLLPSNQTSKEHIDHALKVAKLAKLPKENIIEIPITAIIQKTWRVTKQHSQQISLEEKDKTNRKHINQKIAHLNRIRIGNIAARARMIVLFDQAKKLEGLVVGTENKSEHLLGYYTRFGDQASDLEPIRHLYKTQLIKLAEHLQIPADIIEKHPTAGLWSNQTDEAELGFSYKSADPILFMHIEQDMSAKDILKNTQLKNQKRPKKN